MSHRCPAEIFNRIFHQPVPLLSSIQMASLQSSKPDRLAILQEIQEKKAVANAMKKDLLTLKQQLQDLKLAYTASVSQLSAQLQSLNPASRQSKSQAPQTATEEKKHWNDWQQKFPPPPPEKRVQWTQPSQKDVKVVTKQLGRHPEGVWEVATRCPSGHPQTLRVYPLKEDRRSKKRLPHPTYYWLTCPAIISQIGVIENDKGCARAKEWVLADEEREKEYKRNHMQYAAERFHSLKLEDVKFVDTLSEGMRNRIKYSGIGGSAEWTNFKCLHQIYAHHLNSNVNTQIHINIYFYTYIYIYTFI
ncbi:hypothetical protein AAMO2058_000140200 [Amorphochlora amoebiformis]